MNDQETTLAQADQLIKEGMEAFLSAYPNLSPEKQTYYAALGFVTEAFQKMEADGHIRSDWDEGFNAGYSEGRKANDA
jgi:hypothetical protein